MVTADEGSKERAILITTIIFYSGPDDWKSSLRFHCRFSLTVAVISIQNNSYSIHSLMTDSGVDFPDVSTIVKRDRSRGSKQKS